MSFRLRFGGRSQGSLASVVGQGVDTVRQFIAKNNYDVNVDSFASSPRTLSVLQEASEDGELLSLTISCIRLDMSSCASILHAIIQQQTRMHTLRLTAMKISSLEEERSLGEILASNSSPVRTLELVMAPSSFEDVGSYTLDGIASSFKHLTSLTLYRVRVVHDRTGDQLATVFSQCPNLSSLTLLQCRFRNGNESTLGSCIGGSRLQELTLGWVARLHDSTKLMLGILACPTLRKLTLSGSMTSRLALSGLAEAMGAQPCPTLRSLDLGDLVLGQGGGQVSGASEYSLPTPSMTDFCFALQSLPQLERLIHTGVLDNEACTAMATTLLHLKHLREWRMCQGAHTTYGLCVLANAVRDHPSLQWVTLAPKTPRDIDDETCAVLKQMVVENTRLQELQGRWSALDAEAPLRKCIVSAAEANVRLQQIDSSWDGGDEMFIARKAAIRALVSCESNEALAEALASGLSPNSWTDPDGQWLVANVLKRGDVDMWHTLEAYGLREELTPGERQQCGELVTLHSSWHPAWHWVMPDEVDVALETALAMNMEEREVMFEAGGMEGYEPKGDWWTMPDEVMERVLRWMVDA